MWVTYSIGELIYYYLVPLDVCLTILVFIGSFMTLFERIKKL